MKIWQAFLDHVVFFEGSTRAVGLMRIPRRFRAWV